MVLDNLAVGVASGLVGALLGYILALRAAKRERFFEIKQQTYGGVFPQIQESIDIIGEILAIEDLDLKEGEKAQGQLVRLMRPLWVLGIEGGVSEVAGQLEEFKGKKPTIELLANIRNTVNAWLMLEFYGILRELRHDFAALEFTPPNAAVKSKLDSVLSMVGGDELALGLRSLLKESGLSGMLGDVDFKLRAEAYRNALSELRDAMRTDLAKTL